MPDPFGASWTVVAATGALPDFLTQLVALVGVAAVIGYVCSRLGIVPIVGFLLAGVLIGPAQLGLVDDRAVIDIAAEVGVILLLFTIGLEFSLERLNQIRRVIVVGGGAQVVLATVVTAGIALAAGVGGADAVFTGLLVALSSTAIVLRILTERGESSTPRGQAATAVLLFQDLAVVAMVLVVPLLGGSGGGPADIAIAFGKAAGLVVVVLVVARRGMPRLLDVVARTCSPEVFLLTIVAVCFGTALASAQLGVSVSLGAFLAGLVVSESRHGTHAFGEILPLQILFSATFFVSVGMLADLGFLLEEPLLVAGCVAGAFVVKALTATVAVRLVGVALPTAAGAGLLLAQVGEFSFVLDVLGRGEGLSALGLGADGSQALIATTVVLMVATPGLAAVGAAVERRIGSRRAGGDPVPAMAGVDAGVRHGHAIVAGYGTAARAVVSELRRAEVPFTVVTLSPDGAAELERTFEGIEGVEVLVGDYAKQAVLVHAGVASARLLAVVDDDPERTLRVTALARSLNPDVAIVARPLGEPEVAEVADAGADHVVTPERASQIGVGLAVRAVLGGGDGPVPLSTVWRFAPDPHAGCRHLSAIEAVQPSAAGCEDCLRIGSTWVHLRICLSCGHVGCCDSSPHRHAREHADSEVHPLIASFERGERWAYCYLDDETVPPAATRAVRAAAPAGRGTGDRGPGGAGSRAAG